MLSGFLFAWLGSTMLNLGYRLNATGYHQVLYHTCGTKLGGILDVVTSIFLFGGLTIMLAGAGTVGRDFLGLSYNAALIAMALIVAVTVLTGMKGISIVNSIVTPLLVISTIAIGINSILHHGLTPGILSFTSQAQLAPTGNWLMSALLYTSYNLILGATVLAPLGSQIKSPRVRLWGGLLGGFLLALLGLFIALIIILHSPEVFQYEVPMLYVSNLQHEFTHAGYAAMLVKAMYSTAMASLYGCTVKVQAALGLKFSASMLLIILGAILCSQAGFANLIGTVYPVFGYFALIFTVRLVLFSCRGN